MNYKKYIPAATHLMGMAAFLFGAIYASSDYKLLYFFAGGGDGKYNSVGIENMPSSIVGYMLLSYAGIFISLIGSKYRKKIVLNSEEPNQSSKKDAKNNSVF